MGKSIEESIRQYMEKHPHWTIKRISNARHIPAPKVREALDRMGVNYYGRTTVLGGESRLDGKSNRTTMRRNSKKRGTGGMSEEDLLRTYDKRTQAIHRIRQAVSEGFGGEYWTERDFREVLCGLSHVNADVRAALDDDEFTAYKFMIGTQTFWTDKDSREHIVDKLPTARRYVSMKGRI